MRLIEITKYIYLIYKKSIQCGVSVTDQGYPEPKTDTAGTSITVQRDVALPVFDQETYRREIAESVAVNTSVSQVHAEMDGVIVSFD